MMRGGASFAFAVLVTSASLCCMSCGFLILDKRVPVAIHFGDGGTGGGAQAAIRAVTSSTVDLCVLDWEARRANPASTPMFHDLVAASPGCANGDEIKTVPWSALEEEYDARGCGAANASDPGCEPRGGVFHQARCGSTLISNMLAALPGAYCYSESGSILHLLTAPAVADLPEEARIRFLRVLLAAYGRPLVAAAANGDTLAPTAGVYLKFQSRLALHLPTWRAAFPASPWAFVHRNGTEILASNFRGAARPTSEGESLDRTAAGVDGVPCMSSSLSPAVLALLGEPTVAAGKKRSPEDVCSAYTGAMAIAALDAGHKARLGALIALGLGHLAATLTNTAHANSGAGEAWAVVIAASGGLLAATGAPGGVGQGVMVDYPTLPDAAFALIMDHFGLSLPPVLLERLAAVTRVYSKVRKSAATAPDANANADAVDGVREKFPSMNRYAAADKDGYFIGDTTAKLDFSWPALRAATARYTEPSRRLLLSFNAPNVKANANASNALIATADALLPAPVSSSHSNSNSNSKSNSNGTVVSDAAVAGTAASAGAPAGAPGISVIAGAEKNLVPLGGGYPALFPLNVVLRAWNPDVTLPPTTYGAFSSLRVFNFSEPLERALASEYRRAEVPFILRGVASLDAAVVRWADDATLVADMGTVDHFTTEISNNQHFMYFNRQRAKQVKDFVPPTREGEMDVVDWLVEAAASLEIVRAAEHAALGITPAFLPGGNSGHVGTLLARGLGPLPATPWAHMPSVVRPLRDMNYMRASAGMKAGAEGDARGRNAWITDTVRAFVDTSAAESVSVSEKEEYPFFIVDPQQQRGIHCRFGMAGIIAEAHTDAGRNFITMQRGHKRYILAPPFDCDKLGIANSGPISRHSIIDWSSEEGIATLAAQAGLATEVVLTPGDALYVPAGWFHYIISLDTNIQCNSRSGTPDLWISEMKACGVAPPSTETLGDRTNPFARALQPLRSLHLDVWRKLWPAAALAGLAPELLGGLSEAVVAPQAAVDPRAVPIAPPLTAPLEPLSPAPALAPAPLSAPAAAPTPKLVLSDDKPAATAAAAVAPPIAPPPAPKSGPSPLPKDPIALPAAAWAVIGVDSGSAAEPVPTIATTSGMPLAARSHSPTVNFLTRFVVGLSVVFGAIALCVRFLLLSRPGSVLPSVVSSSHKARAASSPRHGQAQGQRIKDEAARDMLSSSSGWRRRIYAPGDKRPVVLAELIRTTQSMPIGVGIV